MSRVERVGSLLRQIEQETCEAFDEHTELLNENRRLEAENAKLRFIVCNWYPHMVKRVGIDALTQWGYMDLLRKLGIEVSDV